MRKMAKGMKRACALVLSAFMILSQFAFPLTALAQNVNELPQVTLYYTEGENTLSVPVWASLYGEEPVYWATVPSGAFAGVTLEIAPSADAAVTYNSSMGYQLTVWDSSAVDGNAATYIEVYRDGAWQASYPLYLSSIPMPQPEPEPEPEPVPATITVKYVDSQTGAELYSDGGNSYYAGDHTFTPDMSVLPSGYTVSGGSVTVTVYEDGSATQSEVVFFATPPAQNAFISVVYVDSRTGAELSRTSHELGEGEHPFAPDPYAVPDGYTLDSMDPVYVTVYADGTASMSEVVFYVTPNAVEAVPAFITVKYVDAESGEVLYTDGGREYDAGEHYFQPDAAYVPAGYTADLSSGVTVTVYEDGTASQSEVVFLLAKAEPDFLPSFITVKYLNSQTGEVLYTDNGSDYYASQTFYPDASLLPQHFVLDSTEPVTIEVRGDGMASEISFYATYQEPAPEQPDVPAEAVVMIYYIGADGFPVHEESQTFTEGTHKITAHAVEGYTLNEGQPLEVEVTVDAYGAASTTTVMFFVTKAEAPVEPEQPVEPPVEPDAPTDPSTPTVPEGSTLLEVINGKGETTGQGLNLREGPSKKHNSIGKISVTGTVVDVHMSVQNADGEVWYQVTHEGKTGYVMGSYLKLLSSAPVSADVSVRYVDETGNSVAEAAVKTLGEGSHSTAEWKLDIPGYTYMGVNADTVNITANGADVFEVIFTYQRNPVSADVSVRYVDEVGSPVAEAAVKTLGEGSHSTAEWKLDIPGYTYMGVNADTVNITANGADVLEVIFTYQRNPVSADVSVRYVDEAGNSVAEAAVKTLGEGSHSTAEWKLDIPGYTYMGVNTDTVNITANGADVLEIIFTYQRNPVIAQVIFRYVDEQGNAVPGLEARTENLSEGAHDTAAYAVSDVAGYRYTGATAAQVIVSAEGASPSEVLFTYTRLPDAVTLPVYFFDGDRQPLMEQQTITFTSADFGKSFDSLNYVPAAPEGYEFAGVSSDVITVDAFGGLSPAALEITYTVKPKATARVTFEYLSVDGKKVADIQTVDLAEGTHDVMEYAAKPDKYNFQSVSSQTVTITADGKAEPEIVTFTYTPVRDKATLKVHYRSAIGEDFPGSPELRELPVGQHTITPNAAFAPQGSYALSASTQQYTVNVTSDLVAEPNSVTFTYYDASVTADVTVRYLDSVSGAVIAEEVRKLTPGTHDLAPNEQLIASKGNYVKSSYNTNTRVTVNESGRADYASVIFYYEPAQSQDYRGYLLVTQQTSLRQQPSQNGVSDAVLSVDTVLVTNGQQMSGATEWYSSVVQTGPSNGKLGWVSGDHVRRISSDEAAARIEEANQPNEPEQNPGLYRTLMDGVPLRRYMTTASEAKYLKVNVIVTVSGQEYDENGYLWHRTSYDGVDGYVRDGQLQKLTPEEVDQYLAGGGNTSSGNPDQYDPNGASSYGYITSDQVNFRSAPGGTKLKSLNKYAMALVIGTRQVDGVTWYNVNYSGQVGWVHGDFFHQMSLTEFTSFMGSNEYYQGITNNTARPTGAPSGSTGSATPGNVGSVEDWNVGTWQNPSLNTQATYQPFNPYATPAATAVPNGTYTTQTEIKFYQSANTNSTSVTLPKDAEIKITGTVTLSSTKWYAVTYDGKMGYVKADELGSVSATPTPAPTSTFVIGTMIPIEYEDESKETQTSNMPLLIGIGAVVLVGGAGGVYAYALNQNRRRKAAARAAAARRAKAQAGGSTSPYARRAVAAPNAPKQPAQMNNPFASSGMTGSSDPFAPNGQYKDPFASGSGSADSFGASAADPFAASTSDPFAPPVQPKGKQNPYAVPKSTNPFAAPVDAAPIVNPYAASRTETPASTNPYARPIGTVTPAQPGPQDPAAPRRRATRMQRYHEADDGNNE